VLYDGRHDFLRSAEKWTKSGPNFNANVSGILFIYLERETGIEPATFSLGS
jgi:hypothetical protein